MSALKEAIQDVGGAKAAARACGVSVRAIYKWMAAEALPRTEYTGETNYIARLAQAAEAAGQPFDVERLRKIASPRRTTAPVDVSDGLADAALEAQGALKRRGERRAVDRRQAERRHAERRA